MNQIYRITLLAASLTATLVTGCASEEKKEASLARVGDETPPDFVVGAASVLLREVDGFRANVVETDTPSLMGAATPARPGHTFSGQAIGRKGRLIFQPWTTALVKKEKISNGGMYFIWDLNNQKGVVVSEALQGYAPIAPSAQITNLVAADTALVSELVNGHPCHRSETVVSSSDGSSAKLTEWQADDLQRFPVRIRVSAALREETVDFTEVHLDLAAPELFLPPSDFTRYANSASLINELMIRESSFKKGSTIEGIGSGPFNPAGAQSGVRTQPY